MRSFICKLVYWIMLKLYVFILWALLPLLTMGKGILIQNVVIFDGKSEKTVTGNVWIEDNAIRKVSAEPIVAGAEVEVIDGRGKFLMPGLIDAHWHAYLAANTMVDLLTAHASYTQLRAGEEAGKTLLRGFTTIRDAGGPVFGLKRAIDEGTLPGPRIYPSGAIISETGGHADFRMVYDIPEPFDCCGLTHTEKIGAAIIADGVDAVIVASRNNLRLGASQIKLMAGGGVSSLYDQLEDVQYFEDELHAAVMAAEDAGTYVMVHVYVPEAIRRAIRAGVKSIEHGQLIDEPTMKLIAEKGVWLSMQPFIGEGNNHYTNPVQQAKHELVVQGTDRAYQLAKKYGVALSVRCQPARILVEPTLVKTLLYNLVDNAVKFIDDGGTLSIRVERSGNKAVTTVGNTGPTIAPEELPLIFDRFHKTDKSRSTDRDGVGLGLYIVKTIVLAHGEDIYVTSRDGKTEFTFTLPLVL